MAFMLPATVSPLEGIGVLAWWSVILIAPFVFGRRWRRRQVKTRIDRPLRSTAANADRTIASQLALRPTALDPSRTAPTRSRSPRETRRSEYSATSLPADALAPLCRHVDFRRRLELAVAELESKLSRLPVDRWRLEPYPLTGDRRNTLLILGETGVFVVSATYAPGHWDDVITVSRLARKIQSLLPGYADEVQGAICHPFSSTPTRLWHRQVEDGEWIHAWVVGGDSVIEWLEHFGSGHGLSTTELERFDRHAEPNWLRPAIPASSTWPPVPETPSCPGE